MSGDMRVCEIDPELTETLKTFRFRKDLQGTSAIILKVDRERQLIVVDQTIEDTTIEDLKEELPDRQPRFLVLSYKMNHDDGRLSYPLCFIFITPRDSNIELQMMYAGSKLHLQKELSLTRVYELRELEELTDDWLQSKIK